MTEIQSYRAGWVRAAERMPPVERPVKCRLRHCSSGSIQELRLVRVDEDDCNWRTASGRYEVSYDWDVLEWQDAA